MRKMSLIIIWSLFFCFLLGQFLQVKIYFDDFGYYSLNYGMPVEHLGHDFSIKELFQFLKNHYLQVNGRVLYFFIWLLSYHFGGMIAVSVLAASGVFFIYLFLWKLILLFNIDLQKFSKSIAVFTCLSFGLLEVWVLSAGMYWFAAYFQYVFSILPFLLFNYLYFLYREKMNTCYIMLKVLLTTLIFLASYSQESISVALVGFTIMLLIYEKKEEHFSKWNVIFVIVAVVGMLLLMLSPGIRLRASNSSDFYNLNIFQKILLSYPEIIKDFYLMTKFQIGLSISQIFISVMLIRKQLSKSTQILNLVIIIIFSCIGLFFTFFSNKYINFYNSNNNSLFFTVLGTFVIFIHVVQISKYYLHYGTKFQLLIFYMSVLSIACLVVVPERPYRLFLPFLILSTIIIIEPFMHFILLVHNSKMSTIILCVGMVLFTAITVPNMNEIFSKYQENAIVWDANNDKIEEASKIIANGQNMKEISLEKLPNSGYSGEMLYSGAADFMSYWMCLYYKVPFEFEFNFE
ncbi:MAG: DUF6056 family protein [Lachnospiraceae bacterium]